MRKNSPGTCRVLIVIPSNTFSMWFNRKETWRIVLLQNNSLDEESSVKQKEEPGLIVKQFKSYTKFLSWVSTGANSMHFGKYVVFSTKTKARISRQVLLLRFPIFVLQCSSRPNYQLQTDICFNFDSYRKISLL